ncbi:MAG: hypothetical protein M5R42_05410 [Rhodocyclaceae bacterium]|nr:hypothetical protein [Rhodocyclaceae bacterium]
MRWVNEFAACGPPGHHAERPSYGFCFSTMPLPPPHALEVHGWSAWRWLIFDVHHGNGTEDIFFE